MSANRTATASEGNISASSSRDYRRSRKACRLPEHTWASSSRNHRSTTACTRSERTLPCSRRDTTRQSARKSLASSCAWPTLSGSWSSTLRTIHRRVPAPAQGCRGPRRQSEESIGLACPLSIVLRKFRRVISRPRSRHRSGLPGSYGAGGLIRSSKSGSAFGSGPSTDDGNSCKTGIPPGAAKPASASAVGCEWNRVDQPPPIAL